MIWPTEEKMAYKIVSDVFEKMESVFDSNAAQGMDAVFQFEITGDGGGSWHIVIKGGTCQVNEGVHEAASVTLTLSAETWLGMVNKEVDGIQAFMSGQLKADGDIMLAQRITQLFPL